MLLVEPLCICRNGVDQDRPNTGNIGGLKGAQCSIAQKPLAETVTVKFLIDCESTDDHYGNGLGHVAPDSAGSAGVRDRANG